ncbi:hypothetical protein A3C96_00415 [Candidatus Uhrbacteria bacterium RIFCSPHIGHO2_02_FULL_60_10]|uniref:Uncharacterized protein n=1 Tax=Candidatus Uhrbacteria bacterium RIFCSPHIGHO2_02_FULL_60_10 TaxID=1802392 RepID=A0A1F7U7N7_9BACT|nr:MAG: hypothetical protein A3C96_00415 [Candidatus Uhrbacteria bacterium RIFCSPHIGHO2_02_FULL_60_10]
MSKITLCDARGPLNDVTDKLSGEDGDLWLAAFKRFLRRENPWTSVGKLVATVVLGTYPTAAKLREALEAAGHKISDWAGDILAKTPISKEKAELDLFEVTVAELGFAQGAARADIYRRAVELGFAVVPAEAGALLRLQLGSQVKGERLLIGMEPLAGRSGDPDVFDVERGGGGSWLYASDGGAGSVWSPGDRWVFGRAK